MKRPIDLIMFDLDGTLADTGKDLASAVNYTRAQFDLPALPDTVVYTHVGRGIEHLIRHTLAEITATHFREAMGIFVQYYEHHLLDTTVLYPNVREMLDYFTDKRRVVVTNKMHRLSVAVLSGLEIQEQFDLILGGDSGPEKKPHPGLLNAALNRFAVAPNKAVIVGDGDVDVEAGRRAGIVTCSVTYGLGSKEDLIVAQPDILIDDLRELANYVY
jgi:phosphoglycolate phosphatase